MLIFSLNKFLLEQKNLFPLTTVASSWRWGRIPFEGELKQSILVRNQQYSILGLQELQISILLVEGFEG